MSDASWRACPSAAVELSSKSTGQRMTLYGYPINVGSHSPPRYAKLTLRAHHRAHRVLKLAFGRASGPDRKDHRMSNPRGTKARDEIAAALGAAECADSPHVGVAQRLVGCVAFTLAQ